MRGKVSWVLLPALLLATSHGYAQCTKDTDCKGDRVCEAGVCTWPTPAGAPAPTAPSETAAPTPPDSNAAPASPDSAPPAAPVAAEAAPPAPAPVATPSAPLDAQPTPPSDEPTTRRRSKPAMVSGIVMVSVGPIALLGALAARNSQQRCDDRLRADYPSGVLPSSESYRVDDCNGYSLPIYVLGIGGALLTAAGIPLIIYGSKNVPAPRAAAHLELEPWASPQAGGLKLRLSL